jgi:phosphoglycerate kinase
MDSVSLPRMQNADLKGKVVLLRVDHNVVKKGKIIDAMRIDSTIPTLFNIVKNGGKLILMTHVGRPYDKKTGLFTLSPQDAVEPIVQYLEHKLQIKIAVPTFTAAEGKGIDKLDPSIKNLIADLKNDKIDMIYLPNTRWFTGEESKGEAADTFGKKLIEMADVYINDAFGSWQAHVSTMKPTEKLPSYAGLLMQKELDHLQLIFAPKRPFVGIVAGSKFDTKIGPLSSLLEKVDYLVLGGVIYNAYLSVKYELSIKGLAEDDLAIAAQFLKDSEKYPGRIIELPYIIESDTLDGKFEGQYRTHNIHEIPKGKQLNYILDADPKSFEIPGVRKVFDEAAMFFVNAVMGFTPNFGEGTAAMYSLIDTNKKAKKLFGGGDTLQDFRNLLVNTYLAALDNETYYFFTGGGAVLNAIEQGSPFGMEPVQALIKNGGCRR